MERDCGLWINMVAHKLKKNLNARLADLGITGVQSRILHYVLTHYEEGPVYQRDVEEMFELSRSTTTGVLQLLEKNGMIVRESVASDARLKSLVPTQKAAEVDAKVGESIREMEQRITKGLSAGQVQMFLELIEQMSRNMES